MAKKKKTVTVKGWVAKNINEIDIENMSFYFDQTQGKDTLMGKVKI